MQNLNDGWYIEIEYYDGTDWHTKTSDYMSKEKAEKYCNDHSKNDFSEMIECRLKYDKDFDIDGELISYGIHKQDFYAIIKCDRVYILYNMIPIPVCDFCDELKIKEHLEMFETDCKYKGVFRNLKSVFDQFIKI